MAGKPEDWLYMYRIKNEELSAALEEETRQKKKLETTNNELKAGIETVKTDFAKFEQHTKYCNNQVKVAQQAARDAKGAADHRVKSQQGQLKNAERNWDTARRELLAWKEKYESLEKPAEEKHALQVSVAEWQAKAEKAQKEITSLEAQIEGTPEKIGLHQALEQWEEHQGCSKAYAALEDKLQESTERERKAESDLAALKNQHQKAKVNIKALQTKNTQLSQAAENRDQTDNYMQRIMQLEAEVRANTETIQNQAVEMGAAQATANQLMLEKDEQEQEARRIRLDSDDVDMSDDDMPGKVKLLSDLKALKVRHSGTETELEVLKARNGQLEQVRQSCQDYDKTRNDFVQKLQLDLTVARAEHHATKSNMEVLQGSARQLEMDLNTARSEHQTTKSNMEVLKGRADQLERDLNSAKAENQTTKSNMEVLQGKADQLERDLNSAKAEHRTTKSSMEVLQERAHQLESALGTTKEQHQTSSSDVEALKEKTKQLELDLQSTLWKCQSMETEMKNLKEKAESDLQEKEDYVDELETKTNYLESDLGIAEMNLASTSRQCQTLKSEKEALEEKAQLFEESKNLSEKMEKDTREEFEAYKKLSAQWRFDGERKKVTPKSSPTFTTDEGTQDLELTPRPNKSLHHDLGFLSEEHSGEEQSKTGEQEDAGLGMFKKDDWEAAGVRPKVNKRPKNSLLSGERKKESLEMIQLRQRERAKEQWQSLESIFECEEAKAMIIDRQLKAIGPGCRRLEAPALVAKELSGIPVDTYKRLASGELIATTPPNEVKDVGTDPQVFAKDSSTDTADLPSKKAPNRDMATETTDLPAEQTANTLLVGEVAATRTTDLPVQTVLALKIITKLRKSVPYIVILQIIIMLFSLYLLYMEWKDDPNISGPDSIIFKNINSFRHTPFPTPSINLSTPVSIVYPPTPAPQLGFGTMMKDGLLGGGSTVRRW